MMSSISIVNVYYRLAQTKLYMALNKTKSRQQVRKHSLTSTTSVKRPHQ